MTKFELIENYEPIDSPNKLKKDLIETKQDLRIAFENLRTKEPRLVDLIASDGHSLTIGVGGKYICIMYTTASGNPPYLSAINEIDDTEDFVEFVCGGTPTPIPLSHCFPFEKGIEIIEYFFLTGDLSKKVEWVEE